MAEAYRLKIIAGRKPTSSTITMLRGNHEGGLNIRSTVLHLHHQPRTDPVQPGSADDVAAFEFGDERGACHAPAASLSNIR